MRRANDFRDSPEILRRARISASNYLEMRGFHIIEHGWQQVGNHVDIIARYGETIYFITVRFDTSDVGMAEREKCTERARKLWVEENKWHGLTTLASLEVALQTYEILSFNQ
jgi:Holliday junction resolvase-like predicted endonuclease